MAAIVAGNLGAPDIVAVQEVQDDTGPEDDGTVSAARTLELLVELERLGYSRAIYFDTFPDSSGLDPQAETETNIAMVERLRAIARTLTGDKELAAAIARHDATASQRIVADTLYSKPGGR